eukprot:1830463-Pyramimonas_sp.AAC.1
MVMVFLTCLALQMSYRAVQHRIERESSGALVENGDIFLTKLELQMAYRAVRHSNGKELIRRDSLQYLDA